jgi:hypothetical protein
MFENKTYSLEPMKNTTDSYKLVPAESMTNIQGLCGSQHNKSNLTMEDVSPGTSQMRARRVRGDSTFMFLEPRAATVLRVLEQPRCRMLCAWNDIHSSGGRGYPGENMCTNSNSCTFEASVSIRSVNL